MARYIVERIGFSPVVLFTLSGRLRPGTEPDIVLVRRDSVVVLSNPSEGAWSTTQVFGLPGAVRDACVLRRPQARDVLVILDTKSQVSFLDLSLSDSPSPAELCAIHPNSLDELPFGQELHYIAVDPLGRGFCAASAGGGLIHYGINPQTYHLAINSRKVTVINGLLLRCCFLSTSNDLTYLVYHYVQDSQSLLGLIEYRVVIDKTHPRQIPMYRESRICLFMLPLIRRTGYLLHVSTTRLALISAQHIQCGDLSFNSCDLRLHQALPSAISEITSGSKANIAIMSADDGGVYLISEKNSGKLIITLINRCAFPATSLLSLENEASPADDIWRFLAASDDGRQQVFECDTASIIATELSIEGTAPLTDICVIPENEKSRYTSLSVLGGRGLAGTISKKCFGLQATMTGSAKVGDLGSALDHLFVVPVTTGYALLMISLPWASRLLHSRSTEPFDDLTERFGIHEADSTLLFCEMSQYSGLCVQVTNNVVYRCSHAEANCEVIFEAEASDSITFAQNYKNLLTLITHGESGYNIIVLNFPPTASDTDKCDLVQSSTPVDLPSEPIVMRLSRVSHSSYPLLSLCLAAGEILLWYINEKGGLDFMRAVESPEAFHLEADTEEVMAIYDHWPLESSQDCQILLLLSYRSGELRLYLVPDEGSKLVFLHGAHPNRVPNSLAGSTDGTDDVYYYGEASGRISIINQRLRVDQVILPMTVQRTYFGANPFRETNYGFGVHEARQDLSFIPRDSGFITYDSGILNYYTVGKLPERIESVLNLESSPRRVLYLERFECLMIATYDMEISESSRILHSNIYLINQDGEYLSELPVRDHKERLLLKPGDSILAMTSWDVIAGRHWVVLGGSRTNLETGSRQGLLTILRLKQHNSEILIWKELAPYYSDEITALCPMLDCLLVMGSGLLLYVIKLDLERRGLVTVATFPLRSIATNIQVSENHIFLTTKKESLIILQYNAEEQNLSYLSSVSDHAFPLSMSLTLDNILVLTDKLKNVSLYQWSAETTSVAQLATFKMPSAIVRARSFSIDAKVADKLAIPFIPDDHVIVAAGIDGTLYTIFRIHSDIYDVLCDRGRGPTDDYSSTKTRLTDQLRAPLPGKRLQAWLEDCMTDLDISEIRHALQVRVECRTTRLLA